MKIEIATNLAIAFQALKVNKLRSSLTMLGIIIGVAAVITMIAVGGGAQARVKAQISSLGSNLMIIIPGSLLQSGVRLGTGNAQTLTEDDANAILREIPEVAYAAPISRGGGQIISSSNNWGTTIYGVNPDFFEAREWPLASGRMFEYAEIAGAGKVVILGQTVANQLFGSEDPIDQQVRIKGVPFTVIGITEKKGQSMQGQDQDDGVFVPLSTGRRRIFGEAMGRIARVGSIAVKVQDGNDMKMTEQKITELLRQRHRTQMGAEDDFTIRNLTEILEAQEAASKVMSALLAAVASVSLLVGGIGIMNIMLVSVTERTREIGLRMAIGAKGTDILEQFLVEAMTLATLGGLIGIVLGFLASELIAILAGWAIQLSLISIILAVGFSAAIGIFFGFYPAKKAAMMQPIQALRYE